MIMIPQLSDSALEHLNRSNQINLGNSLPVSAALFSVSSTVCKFLCSHLQQHSLGAGHYPTRLSAASTAHNNNN